MKRCLPGVWMQQPVPQKRQIWRTVSAGRSEARVRPQSQCKQGRWGRREPQQGPAGPAKACRQQPALVKTPSQTAQTIKKHSLSSHASSGATRPAEPRRRCKAEKRRSKQGEQVGHGWTGAEALSPFVASGKQQVEGDGSEAGGRIERGGGAKGTIQPRRTPHRLFLPLKEKAATGSSAAGRADC